MRTMLFAAALALAATGCSKKSDAPAPAADHAAATIPSVTVDQVDQMIAQGKCQAVDANGEITRKKLGTLPGAVLLTDSESYQLSELPADKSKQLVFYCANTACGASHQAAERALTAGYTNVKVMPAGIAGWVSTGKKTAQL